MTAQGRLIFALLVCATLGAFFVTQRLKSSPRIVRALTVTNSFSPNGDHHHDRASIRFVLSRSDEISVTIIDKRGDRVRRLASGRSVRAHRKLQFFWNGRDDDGRVTPDGRYRIRIGLRHQGRSVVLIPSVVVDDTPPRPIVRVVGPSVRGNGPVRVRLIAAVRYRPRYSVYRTDGPRFRLIARFTGLPGSHTAVWDGLYRRRPAPPGTYVIVARLRDGVGNLGASFPLTREHPGDPAGGPGVTVRTLAAQPPLVPVGAGGSATVFVNARSRGYRWRLRRLGGGRLFRGAGARAALRLRVPRGPSGVYLLNIRTGGERPHRRATNRVHLQARTVPLLVQGPHRHHVLVMLPALSWQGRNPVDDDGDGMPDMLTAPAPETKVARPAAEARIARPLAGDGLPRGFAGDEGPLLSYLDRAGLRFDLTTDLALYQLGAGLGPFLDRHRGLILAGDPTWLPTRLGRALRDYVEAGGRVLTLGPDALRRSVRLLSDRMVDPSAPAVEDLFAARLDPVVNRPVQLLAAGDDRLGLFAGTDGLFSGFGSFQRTASLGGGAQLVGSAGQQQGQLVILAYRLGRGLVIHIGLPGWSARLRSDPDVAALTRRAWTLLSR